MALSTIGYENARPEDFIRTLQMARIKTVIDVRDRAQSRRPGFSKSALSQLLEEAGISYVHLRELGDPREGREAARAGDFGKFRKIYANVLRTSSARMALRKVKDEASKTSACLLCYERDPDTCHRKIVADKIAGELGIAIRHLGVRRFEQAA